MPKAVTGLASVTFTYHTDKASCCRGSSYSGRNNTYLDSFQHLIVPDANTVDHDHAPPPCPVTFFSITPDSIFIIFDLGAYVVHYSGQRLT